MLFYDENTYYCFQEIEKRRSRLLHTTRPIDVEDFGTGTSSTRYISKIAQTSLAPAKEGQLLFRLVQHLQPTYLIELGTSLGITTSYLAKGAERGKLYTLEGSKQIAAVAHDTLHALRIDNVEIIRGNIDDTLDNVLSQLPRVDFAFLDANHTEDATLLYFNKVIRHCTDQSIVVLDDIHYSRGMHRAWKNIQQHERVSCTMDLYGLGIVFFDKQYLHKHYTLKI